MKMKVLMVEPWKHPYEMELEHTLEAMRQALECDTITAICPWKDPVALVTDDEGMYSRKKPNRYIQELEQYIVGNFFLCGLSSDTLTDLPEQYIKKYKELFWIPEVFGKTTDRLLIFHMIDDTWPD